jgi:hypothetical protein
VLSRLTIGLFSLMFFLSALDVFASVESFERSNHIKARVNTSLTVAAFEQSEDCDDHESLIVPFLLIKIESQYPSCTLTKEVFQFTCCNRSRASTYLTLKALRI